MLETVSLPKRDRLKKYRFDIDRKISVYSDVLLRLMIVKALKLNYKDIEISAGETGKPYLAFTPHLEFNVSHTRNAVAVALSDKPVGVDVERIGCIDLNLAGNIFSQNELKWLYASEHGRNRRFFEIWTKKEAVIKCGAYGLTDDLKAVDVTCCAAPRSLCSLRIGEYIVSVCSNDIFSEKDAETIAEKELVRLWRQHCLLDSNSFNGEEV